MDYTIQKKKFKNGKVQIAYYVKNKCIGNLYLYDLGEPAIYIKYLYIQPKFQRKGIGTLLIKEVLKECNVCSLYVDMSNTNAINFYKQLGFFISMSLVRKRHYLMTLNTRMRDV